MDLTKLVDWLLPPDDPEPKQMRRYWLRLGLVACSSWLTMFLLVIPAHLWSLPIVGKVAFGGEVDEKIATAIEPIQEQLGKVTELAKNGAAETLAQSIFVATKEKCAAQSEKKSALFWTTRLIELRAKYSRLTGLEFPPLDCKDL